MSNSKYEKLKKSINSMNCALANDGYLIKQFTDIDIDKNSVIMECPRCEKRTTTYLSNDFIEDRFKNGFYWTKVCYQCEHCKSEVKILVSWLLESY